SPEALLCAAQGRRFDVILMDLNYARDTTSGAEGLDLLNSLRGAGVRTPVVVMTAWSSVELAVAAMQRGASDFVQKPWDNFRLLTTLQNQAEKADKENDDSHRWQTEIEIARNVQRKLFPRNKPRLETLEYDAGCIPAREVSGDYYDYLPCGPGRLGFVLADVSGKGVAAALLMANLQASFRSEPEDLVRHPAHLIEAVNSRFRESTPAEQYATVFFGHYDESSRKLRYANCGHPAPLLLRREGDAEWLESTGTVLGMFQRWNGEEREVEIRAEDVLIAYSDGISEAETASGEELGRAGILVAARAESVPARLVAALLGAPLVTESGHADDRTILAIRGR
ncbi:MAG: PP2C family protein-serine/threonine phosphatase, partial [Bryobacteraceae bacterium]